MAIQGARFRFRPEHRIRKKSDFARLQKSGRKIYATHFLIVVGSSPTEHSRLGIAVTRKVDPRAVIRNKLRRRLKEIFRALRANLSQNFDILIIARNNAPRCDFKQIEQEILSALSKSGMLP